MQKQKEDSIIEKLKKKLKFVDGKLDNIGDEIEKGRP